MIPVERKPFPYCTTSPRVHSRKWQWIVSHTTSCRPRLMAAVITATTDRDVAQVWTSQQPNGPRLTQHPLAPRIEQRLGMQARRVAVAEDFDLDAAVGLLQLRRHVAHRDRAFGPAALAAGGHPAA